MAVRGYIQTAMTQIQAALADIDTQNNTSRQNTENMKRQLQHGITTLEMERGQDQIEADGLSDQNHKRGLLAKVSQLNREIDTKKAQMNQADSDVSRDVQGRVQLQKNLFDMNARLTHIMSSPGVN